MSFDIERLGIDIENASFNIETSGIGIENAGIDIESLGLDIEEVSIDIDRVSPKEYSEVIAEASVFNVDARFGNREAGGAIREDAARRESGADRQDVPASAARWRGWTRDERAPCQDDSDDHSADDTRWCSA